MSPNVGTWPLVTFWGWVVFSPGAFAQQPSGESGTGSRGSTSILDAGFDPWGDPTNSEFAPSTSGDADLGEQLVLMPQDGYRPFSFRLTQSVFWTDNAGLADLDVFTGLEDVYSTTDLRFSYLPQIAGNTYGEISAGYAFYRYLDHSVLDFDRLEASAGLIHAFRDLNDLSAWLRYNHTRLLTARDHDELFTDHSIELGLYYPIPLGARHLVFGSYSSEFSLDGNPSRASRHEHGLTAGYRYSATDRLEFAGHYRFYLFDYLEGGRTDLLHSAGLSLTARVTDRIDIVASANYSLNDSNLAGFDYEVGDYGASLSLKLEF